MVAKVHSMGLYGMEAFPVEVEADLSPGLPAYELVGLPDAAVKESRDRVRSALRNCGFDFPVGRITMNLAPADKRKEGPIYDLPLLLALCLFLAACGPRQETPQDDGTLDLVATTYPVYLFAAEVTRGAENVTLTLMIDQPISCLHDYTLTVKDMKALERADGILLSGAGLEEAMEDALASSSAPVIDCSAGVDLLESEGHVHQDGEEEDDHGHFDPHYWMDPENMEQMVYNIRDGLSQADPEHAGEYEENAAEQAGLLHTWDDALQDMIREAEENAGVEISGLITFHDGFRYFAEAFDLPLLASIEEEEGSEASAMEINEITQLVKEHQLPVIFTEVNGADATAQIIHRECGVPVYALTLMMSAGTAYEEPGVATYLNLLQSNLDTLREAYL